MGHKAKVLGAAAVLMVVMAVASTAWACQSARGAYVEDLVPARAQEGVPVVVKGGGWGLLMEVQVGWQTEAAGEVQPLTTVSTDQGGNFTISVPVPASPAGVHYVSVSQGSTTRLMPLEVEAAGASPVASAPPAGNLPQVSADATGSGLGDIPASSSSSSASLLVVVVAAAGVLVLAGLATAEVRRRRVRVRAGR